VANDVQENRLWTLKTNEHRLGATNVVITKKVGQWFAKHMTERFDRVLCDAPCTAQGTVRKDSDALRYCGLENIEKMARLQVQLLEAAIHAAKVGGTVVYSTCTLTPEENEGVVLQILKTFGDRVTVEKPEGEWAEKPIADSIVVQKTIDPDAAHPMLRLWPQTLDTEGFFSVILKKHATTKEPEEMEWVKFQEEPLPSRRIREAMEHFTELYGTPVLRDGETLFQLGENVLLTTTDVVRFGLPLQDFSLGLPFAKLLKDGRVRIAHEMATLRGHEATKGTLALDPKQLEDILDGKDTTCDPSLRGDMLLLAEGRCIGRGLAKEGVLKNNLPRLMIQQS
jgi:16S rRNA (cytosine1407-C5)-methyltransferase